MILVTGATGFVGTHLVTRLLQRGEQVRVLARSIARTPGVEAVSGDIADLSSVTAAAQGCIAVIHLVGIIRERPGATFQNVHVDGTRAVIGACQRAGVRRLVHMSALGSRPNATSRYHQTKWAAEELVRASGLPATIFRPSVMFGTGNSFLKEVRGLLHRGPFIPVIGNGRSRLQPAWVEDVVSCFVGALDRPETFGQAYDLGGPEQFTFDELVDILAAVEGVRKPKVHLPVSLMRPIVRLGSHITASFPVTPDQLTMLLEDSTCDIGPMRETFGVTPAPLRDHLRD
jgi:uncharacterized protein YbjT (DUF2867 family)